MPRSRHHRQTAYGPEPAERGFTIVEVMMASVILVVGFMGMISAMTATSGMMDHARRQTVAKQMLNREIDALRFASWSTISGLPTASTTMSINTSFWPTWSSTATYSANHVVSYNGASYRCILAHSNQTPTNTTYWTSVTTGATSDIVNIHGASYTLTRSLVSPDPVTNIRCVNYTVTWVATTSRRDSSGNPLTFTYSRTASAWYGKYGLNLSYQRS
jgi:prepilin-type N-terminal cleavage/methylation domain-containing protein